ncbi:A-kinase anchor protein 9 isoform X3 [Electrophorus electricus]|uniref:A-kinase anchor protein 9 isoform X3 n=1 Tax=Electrophorus electricus TaxID=8005 RepID=UPI0015D085F4|nr:A-kinase anchor protein 9 isoform X3 [Electrophorus electricus]
MSKGRWVELKICQTISCSAPISRRRRPPSPTAAGTTVMEDEERQRKLEAGKAKLAEYRQRKAQSDEQKKQKKKKKKKKGSEEEHVREAELDPPTQQEVTGARKETATTELCFTKTLRSRETVKHDQTYTLEPESEVSTTAEDCSSEVNGCREICERSQEIRDEELCGPASPLDPELLPETPSRLPATKDKLTTQSREGEELRPEMGDVLGAEGVQQDFESALKQRDGIITQLTTNLQEARVEKDEVMREFLQLTQQSQNLQLQFQQLQAGESLRSSNINSAAADLLQTRQQLVHYQQQLEERDAQVRGHHAQLRDLHRQIEERDAEVRGLQEKVLRMTSLQQKISKVEMVTRETEDAFTQRLQDKDQCIAEQERALSQLRDHLQASERCFRDVSEQLAVKTRELQRCEVELQGREAELQESRQKERLSSAEVMQLMGTVEAMQKRHHQGSQSEEGALQRAELDAARRLELLRAELDELYGQQIVQMKQELLAQHAEEMTRILGQHSKNVEKISEHHRLEMERLRARWSQSAGEVNALNAKLVDVQQRLQEAQVLRERAEQDRAQLSALQEQMKQHGGVEQNQAEAEQGRTEVERLHMAIGDLQAQLVAAEQVSSELEARHESEITNYRIKLDMLEREKDAVLDRMAESQEAELEKLRTQMLFSHEEELSRLREDLQHKSERNAQNLRDELEHRHRENVQQLCRGYEERLRAAEDQSAMLGTERVSLLQEILALKTDLNCALESSWVKEGALVEEEKCKVTTETEQGWDTSMQSENKLLKASNTAMAEQVKLLEEGCEALPKKVEVLLTEKQQAQELTEQLQGEVQTQRNTFSFAEKNFEVNYQELKEEYAYLAGQKVLLERCLEEQGLEYAAKRHSLETQLQHPPSTSTQHPEEVEKDTVELMEKLQRVEKEKLELVEKVEHMEVELQRVELEKVGLMEQKEAELQRVELEKVALVKLMEQKEVELHRVELEWVGHLDQKEAELHKLELEKAELVDQMDWKEAALQRVELEKAALVELMEQKEVELHRVELEKVGLLEQKEVQRVEFEKAGLEECVAEVTEKTQRKEAELQALGSGSKEMVERARRQLEDTSALPVGGDMGGDISLCSVQGHYLQISELEGIAALQGEGQMPQSLLSSSQGGAKVEPTEGLLPPPLSQAESGEITTEEGRKRAVSVHEPSAAADVHTHDEETLLYTCHEQVNSPDVHKNLETESRQKVTCLASMDGSEHVECRLQMEAQRISLCQIHTAQLELLQESLHTHTNTHPHAQAHTQTQETLEWLRVQSTDDPKSSKYQRFMDEMTEDCNHLIQSFSRVLGVEVVESLQCREDPVEPRDLTHQRLETCHLRELLVEARELYMRLQQLNQCVLSSHRRLMELQTSLNTSTDKSMQREEDFQRFSTTRPTLTRRKADMGSHMEQGVEQRAELWAELTEEFQKQQELREEQHREEVEYVRTYYREQAREVEQRYTAEISLLQDRLQQLSRVHTLHSTSSASLPTLEQKEQFQTPFLQGSHQKLCELEQHSCDGALSVTQEQQSREEVIAKVIVQMAVDFAQQSERVRMGRMARESSTGTQTVAGAALPAGGNVEQLLEELRRRQEEVLLLTQKLEVPETPSTFPRPGVEQDQPSDSHITNKQGAELTGVVKRAEQSESAGRQHGPANMQNSGTQTEWRGVDEEGNMKKEEDHGGDVMLELSSPHTEFSADVTTERNFLRRANERLRQVLVDVLKTTAAAEETIGRHVEGVLEADSRGQQPQHRDASTESYYGSETVADDASVWSAETETDQGLEMSQMMPGVELQLEREELQPERAELLLEKEEYLMSISTRLQIAVEKLLVVITGTTNQLEHARVTQTELMREKFTHGKEIAELLRRQDELQERLQEEAASRQQLTQQLQQAEGLIDGYSGERQALEEQVRERAQLQLQMEQELQVTSSRLRKLEQERQNLYNQQELLSRQQDAMRDRAGSRELCLVEAAGDLAPEADLLEQTEKLMKEKVDVARQAEKEHAELLQQVKHLEVELEEQVGRVAELEDVHRVETADLTQQIHALEKQLDHNRRFLDEQAMDREHERDVFQQEIQKLEQQLKNLPKPQSSKEQRHRELEELRSTLQEKTDCCSELLLRSERLQSDVEERNEEMERLECRVRELEQALITSTDGLHRVQETTQYASMDGRPDVSLEALLQTEREALDRKEKEIVNLEEQLEQFREELQNKSEEVQQLHMQLEIQKKEIYTQQQELVAQSNLQMVLEEKDREIALLNEQIAKPQPRDTSPENKEVEELGELVRELEAQVEYLHGEQERLKRNSEDQVEQLNSVIEKLQEELSHIEHKQSTQDEMDQDDACCHDEEEYDELKQKMDETTKELKTLKADHSSLLSKYESLQEEVMEREEAREREGVKESERLLVELEEALRDRTAALVVAQAQVQALEKSAASRVTDLNQRVEELEQCIEEKEVELKECRCQVEKARVDAETLHLKISQLEEKLREKVSVVMGQAQLESVPVQTKELHSETLLDKAKLVGSSAELEVENLRVQVKEPSVTPLKNMGLLTKKLRELEEGLSSMQKDQDLQKQLLTNSEQEVQEYQKRLAMLTELLNQMTLKSAEQTGHPAQVTQDRSRQMEGLLQELQEVKGQAAAMKEELDCCKERSQKLQEEMQRKDAMIDKLQTDVQKASKHGSEVDSSVMSELLKELQEVKDEAVCTQEELADLREKSQRLQEQIQTSGEVDSAELLQELQEVRGEAAATKEELNSYIERSIKLQEEIQVRDGSIAELMDEIQQLRAASAQPGEGALGPVLPHSQSKKRAGRDHHSNSKGGSVAKDKPSLSRKNSCTQSETSALCPTSSAKGSEGVSFMDAGTQVELQEELEEVICKYMERIGQMQELHAAEIMDMENRHISESENLKRDNQRLEQECSALRASVHSLRLSETARLEHPTASQFRDGYTSDSSSDWSQRTGFEFRSTPEGARPDDPDLLPDRVKTLLREVHQEGMQVLSLSELPVPEGGQSGAQLPLQAWRKEREALLDTVESLKELLTQLQTCHHTQTHTQAAADWRAELLCAVQQVFMRERNVFKTALISHVDLLDNSDAVTHLNQLQRLLNDQDFRQQEALSSLHTAERSSLLAEISQLQAQLQHWQQDTELNLRQHHPVATTGLCKTWSSAGQEAEQLGTGRDMDVPVSESDSGRSPELELKIELAQTKLELEMSLKTQQKHLKEVDALRREVSAKAFELDSLSNQLQEEQRRVRELQWTVEREASRAERRQEGKREEVEDLRLALEEQQDFVAELSASLEKEREVLAQLTEERDELQVTSEAQQAQIREVSSALQREKELSTQLLSQLQHTQRPLQDSSTQGVEQAEASCGQVEEGVHSVEALLQTLQGQLTQKHSALVELMKQLEQQKLQAVQTQRAWEQERDGLSRVAAHDRSSLQEAQESAARLQRRAEELQARLDGERERGMRLEGERDQLQQRVSDLTEGMGEVELSRYTQQQQAVQWEMGRKPSIRTHDWVLQQEAGDAYSRAPSARPSSHTGHTPATPTDTKNLDNVIARLQLIATKINSMTSDTTHRLPLEGPDRESLTWLQSNMQDVMSFLQEVPSVPPAVLENASLLAGGSSSSVLTERLLRQNAELTGFVSRLTEEKNDLRNQLLKLEEELRRQRHLAAHSFSRSGSQVPDRFSSEREAWSRERSRLEQSLRQAELELSHLRGEVRSATVRDLSVPDADNAVLKRIYGKYLRAESFRKALIYQKKYLILLLGGFQECEEATLSLITHMGGRPTHLGLEPWGHRHHGLTRFRSAVRVSIAISRMRFLVRRWQKATGGSISSPSINRNGLTLTPGGEGRNDSPYLQPTSVDTYGERRGTNRGRTGRDSPRSGHSTLHRYGGAVTDGGGLLCSHLQNYDPDRALTDYISRLEALQRRLGSVQSGSSSYAQLHFGIRR